MKSETGLTELDRLFLTRMRATVTPAEYARLDNDYRRALAIVKHRAARYVRFEPLDKRIGRGDDYAGDAWIDTDAGSVRWVAVGHSLEESRGITQ